MSPLSAIPSSMSDLGIMPQINLAPTEMPAMVAPTKAPLETPGLPSVQPSSDSFSSMLGKFVEEVNGKQLDANNVVNNLQSGGPAPLHQAVIAMEEANVSFQLMVEVRNKLLDAYQEVMHMQV